MFDSNDKRVRTSFPGVSSSTDGGERQQGQERQAASVEVDLLAGIIDSAMDGNITIDDHERIIHFNAAAEAMFLCSAAEALGQPIGCFLPEPFDAAHRQPASHPGAPKVARQAATPLSEIRGRRANGEEFFVEASTSQFEAGGKQVYAIILRNNTRQDDLEEALRQLSERLMTIQDVKQQRVAWELHELNQQVAILSIELQQLSQTILRRKSALHDRMQNLLAMVPEISSEMNRLSDQLYPSKLTDLGLIAAMQDLCDEVSAHQELKIEFRYQGFPAVLPKAIALCLFRIAQELLDDVVKHSRARETRVELEKTDQAVHLTVAIEGCGFDTESTKNKEGLGLLSMRERLRLVGGEISICSQPMQGTQINVSVPLKTLA